MLHRDPQTALPSPQRCRAISTCQATTSEQEMLRLLCSSCYVRVENQDGDASMLTKISRTRRSDYHLRKEG